MREFGDEADRRRMVANQIIHLRNLGGDKIDLIALVRLHNHLFLRIPAV